MYLSQIWLLTRLKFNNSISPCDTILLDMQLLRSRKNLRWPLVMAVLVFSWGWGFFLMKGRGKIYLQERSFGLVRKDRDVTDLPCSLTSTTLLYVSFARRPLFQSSGISSFSCAKFKILCSASTVQGPPSFNASGRMLSIPGALAFFSWVRADLISPLEIGPVLMFRGTSAGRGSGNWLGAGLFNMDPLLKLSFHFRQESSIFTSDSDCILSHQVSVLSYNVYSVLRSFFLAAPSTSRAMPSIKFLLSLWQDFLTSLFFSL